MSEFSESESESEYAASPAKDDVAAFVCITDESCFTSSALLSEPTRKKRW